MSKKFRSWAIVGCGACAAVVCAIGALHWACQYRPPFYRAALTKGAEATLSTGDSLMQKAVNLAGDVRRPGRWQAQFTAEQINGWLAYDEQRGRGRIFSANISDPRLAIDHDCVEIAFCWSKPVWSAIVNLKVEVYLQESNIVAVRIRRARAGLLPLPLAGLINDLIDTGRDFGLEISHQQVEGDPLLLVKLPDAYDHGKRLFSLESLELSAGQVYVAGQSQRAGNDMRPLVKQPDDAPTMGQAQVEQENIQR